MKIDTTNIPQCIRKKIEDSKLFKFMEESLEKVINKLNYSIHLKLYCLPDNIDAFYPCFYANNSFKSYKTGRTYVKKEDALWGLSDFEDYPEMEEQEKARAESNFQQFLDDLITENLKPVSDFLKKTDF